MEVLLKTCVAMIFVVDDDDYVYCLAVLWTISSLVACMYLCRREFIARLILPTLSLHALSKLALYTCRFHYPRNPYDVLYTLFPLPAQSIPSKMTITRSFITRALNQLHVENFFSKLYLQPDCAY